MVREYFVVDADAHVEESEEVWQYVEKEFWDRRPIAVTLDNAPSLGNVNAFWLVDGRPTHRPIGKGANLTLTPITMEAAKAKAFSLGSQSLLDVPARLSDMDALGLDVQVIFPSCFNRPMADDPRLETALHRAWNRWAIDTCKQAPDRLKPVSIMPLQEPEEAVKEARWAKENGAIGLGVYPMMGGRLLDHAAFEPFYATVDDLDLPVCIHVGPDEGLLAPTIEKLGPDIFMLSSDMPHSELREGAAHQVARRADLSDAVKRKIFHENAIRFFGPAIAPHRAGRAL